MTFPISAKIQDGGRNSESSNIYRGVKERILSTQRVQNLLQIALSLTVFEINNIFHFRQNSNACGSHLVFQNEAKNIPRQVFVIMNISCEFQEFNYNSFCWRGVTIKSYAHYRQRNAWWRPSCFSK